MNKTFRVEFQGEDHPNEHYFNDFPTREEAEEHKELLEEEGYTNVKIEELRH